LLGAEPAHPAEHEGVSRQVQLRACSLPLQAGYTGMPCIAQKVESLATDTTPRETRFEWSRYRHNCLEAPQRLNLQPFVQHDFRPASGEAVNRGDPGNSQAPSHPSSLYVSAKPMRVDHLGPQAPEQRRELSSFTPICARSHGHGEHLRAAIRERSLEGMRWPALEQERGTDGQAALRVALHQRPHHRLGT